MKTLRGCRRVLSGVASRWVCFGAPAALARGLASSSSIREIARRLDRVASTVSREVARHGGRPEYRVCYMGLRAHCIERHGLDPIDEDRYFFFDLERGTFTLLLVVKSQHRIPVLRVETAVGGKE